jgi:Bacterial regulatory proteins, luxR family
VLVSTALFWTILIAMLLDLSLNTVDVHRANLMRTLKVHKAAEVVFYAVKCGLVVPEQPAARHLSLSFVVRHS